MKWLILTGLALVCFAGNSQVHKAHRLNQQIEFDGIVGQEEWLEVPVLPMMQFNPNNGAEMVDKTEVYLAYDDEYLYLAGRCYHRDINDILAQSYKRDVFTYASDYFGMMIDQFNDNENNVGFVTTPRATRTDYVVFNDAQGAFPLNETWNTFWDVKTTQDEQGWYTEIRVPWSSLRFNVVDGKTVMGIIYWRNIAKTGESQTPPGMKNSYGVWSSFKPSQSPEFEFEGLVKKSPFYVAPYVLGGVSMNSELTESRSSYKKIYNDELNAGLDVKFSPTSNLTLDLTFNTDFAQVEADDQQVNLTRFSLFFPEKRLFFQERASIFSFITPTSFNRLFYSRRIGLEDGNTVPIIAGARLVGRIGEWDVGLLNMQTTGLDSVDADFTGVDATNFSVVRLRKQVLNPSSYAGFLVTNKTNFKGLNDTSLGVDGSIGIGSSDFLLFGLASTFNSDRPGLDLSSVSKIYLQWQNRSSQGFGYDMLFSRVGSDYDPRMGFEYRNNITNYNPKIWYAWIMPEKSILNTHQVSLESSIFTRNSDHNSVETTNTVASWNYNTKRSADGSITVSHWTDDLQDEFPLSDEDVFPVGQYSFTNVDFQVASRRGQELGVSGNGTLGQFYGGNIFSLGATLNWIPSAIFGANINYSFNQIKSGEYAVDFMANLARIKLDFTFNTRWSCAAFYQFSDAANFSLMNFRLRYNPREGNDLYLVYNEGMNLQREREMPVLPVTDSRTLLLKYTHTFVW